MRRPMERAKYIRTPIKLLTAFVVLALLPLAMLVWLGWNFFEQDRALEAQRQRDQLENAAVTVARDLDRALTAWEQFLTADRHELTDPPAESALLIFDSQGIETRAGISLPYYPRAAVPEEAPAATFASAQALEWQGNLTGAAS